MRQVLFYIPIVDLPIFGYGAMLFVAFVFSVWLAARLAARDGIPSQKITDLAIWILVGGLVGGRITYMYWGGPEVVPLWHFYRIWEGGLVLYGAVAGGVIGFFLAHRFLFKKDGISAWKITDIIAPAGALGIAIGRVGCLLNGCCYGNVACSDCPGICFPLSSEPHVQMVRRGHQTEAGFTFDPGVPRRVGAVENDSAAARAGLQAGDEIITVNGEKVETNTDIARWMEPKKRGENELHLQVKHAGGDEQDLIFTPRSMPLHPTQVYETISMLLLAFLLWSYYPLKRRDGSVMVLFMLGYAVHRFLDEMLRTDTKRIAFGLTLSENISIVLFLAGILLGLWVWLRPAQKSAPPPVSVPI
jgi:phosphatidylglycerol:prolipoprotein diacylglycerol transferase